MLPESAVKGCYFHFGQVLWTKVQNLGLAREFKENEEVRDAIKKFIALSFVPLNNMNEALMIVRSTSPHTSKLAQFMEYMVSTWTDSSARFSRAAWSCLDPFARHGGEIQENKQLFGVVARPSKRKGRQSTPQHIRAC